MSNPLSQDRAQGEVIAQIIRNGLVESEHCAHFVMLNADGSIHKAKGAIELPIFPRSSVKAIQAAGMLRAGLKLSSEQLALVCASHSGSQRHLDIVASILHDCGLDVSALRNTVDRPIGEEERRVWGLNPATSLAQNCSGKHAGMISTCVANGWDVESYLSPDHPLQQGILRELETLAGEKTVNTTADGCGAPLFAISTLGFARAFRAMTISTDPIHQEIMAACRKHPELVAGEGRLTTKLMREIPGLFMKEGAEAVEVATLPDGRTLVFKIIDGSQRAFGPIISSALSEWGIETSDLSVVISGGGVPVGAIIAVL